MDPSPAIRKNAGEQARSILRMLADPAILFFALPWLMILLTWGTVAQKDIGLYSAHELYFGSWIIWAGGVIPLPGAYPTLAAITFSLVVKFLFFSPWHAAKTGTIIAHLGIIILMGGGLLTAMTQREGYIMLRAGQTGKTISDYHDRVLHIEKNGAPFRDIPFSKIYGGMDIDIGGTAISILETCHNCRPETVEDGESRQGLAAQIALREAPLEKENEANLSGITFKAGDDIYIAMEEIPHRPDIPDGKDVYTVSMIRAQSILPFSVRLEKFERDMHPGTDMARGFSSTVTIEEDGVSWPYTIRMNEPLRYKGYTFYQSSFSIKPDGEYSILSVVQNKGRTFPYIASALIFTGLLLHLIIRLRNS